MCGSVASLFPQNKIEAILFGSYARGDAELLLNYGIVVSPIGENQDYFNKNVDVLPFYRNIKRERVRLSA